MARIVTYAHRYKRPPRKRKAVALGAGGRHQEKGTAAPSPDRGG
jgi:hypothetical protein